MGTIKNTASSLTVSYSSMRGVDFSSTNDSFKRYRFSYLENMYRDYLGDGYGVTESIPGFRRIARLEGKPNGMFLQINSEGEAYAVIHIGNSLFRFAIKDRDTYHIAKDGMIAYMKLEKSKSCAYSADGMLYVMDGKKMFCVYSDGQCGEVNDAMAQHPYVPTIHLNREKLEQRNLLTEYAKEIIDVPSIATYAYESDGIIFEVISHEARTCTVAGILTPTSNVYIPYYAKIGGEEYRVISVKERAFYNDTTIYQLHLPESCMSIGKEAFFGCTTLKELHLDEALEEICEGAFGSCTTLRLLYLGKKIKKIGKDAFLNCTKLTELYYQSTESSLLLVEGKEALDGKLIHYNLNYPFIKIEIPVTATISAGIEGLSINGTAPSYTIKHEGTKVKGIIVDKLNRETHSTARIEITYKIFDNFLKDPSDGFLPRSDLSCKEAILGCTIAESFDGRIFLSGNPKLPNTVFYTARDLTGKNHQLYFGAYNYFTVGEGTSEITSLLSHSDSLLIFTRKDKNGGKIYVHKPNDTGIDMLPKTYPVSKIYEGVESLGPTTVFFDEPIFLTRQGLCAIEKQTVNLEKNIGIRSHNVNPRLLSEKLSGASFARWQGYLVIATGEHFYLADPRQTFIHQSGNKEYEWYYLSGLGTYNEVYHKYCYSTTPTKELSIYPNTNEEVRGETSYVKLENGRIVVVTTIDGVQYLLDKDPEKLSEEAPSIPSIVWSYNDELLFFLTENGDLCLFNNDKRGVLPDTLLSESEESIKEYKEIYKGRLHPSFYSFDGFSPRYALKTPIDNCGIPHLQKNTQKGSLAVKLKTFGENEITCEVSTEKGGYREVCDIPDSSLNFELLSFSSLSFENNSFTTLPIDEREKGWVEKQITLYSKRLNSPFGFISLTYNARLKGKIKLK